MPLIKGKSKESFKKNLETEMHEGKPLKQSLAIAYAMKRKAKKKMAEGGVVMDEKNLDLSHESAAPKEDMAAEHEDMKELNQSGDEHEMSMVDRIVAKRMAMGGVVANEGEDELSEMADGQPNEFDDLVLDDHLESHIDSNSELGDAQEDEERADIVSKIMKSRAKKDRLPNPR